jgi:hypothetical protein
MLLVVERREDTMLPPPAEAPRSTERALRHMGWPFPVSNYTVPLPPPRRPVPAQAVAPVQVPAFRPVAEPRRAPATRLPVAELALEVA